MAVTQAQSVDVSAVLATAMGDVDGLRIEPFVSDKSRPPCAVIGLPVIRWNDPEAGFCWATWEYPISIVTARANDRDAQKELSRLVRDVANALEHTDAEGVYSIAMLDARPSTTQIAGAELPSYQVRVQVRA